MEDTGRTRVILHRAILYVLVLCNRHEAYVYSGAHVRAIPSSLAAKYTTTSNCEVCI